MSEEILIRQGAPTLAGIKTGSLFPCPCEDREALLSDIRKLNRRLSPKGLCLLPIRFLAGQALLYLYGRFSGRGKILTVNIKVKVDVFSHVTAPKLRQVLPKTICRTHRTFSCRIPSEQLILTRQAPSFPE